MNPLQSTISITIQKKKTKPTRNLPAHTQLVVASTELPTFSPARSQLTNPLKMMTTTATTVAKSRAMRTRWLEARAASGQWAALLDGARSEDGDRKPVAKRNPPTLPQGTSRGSSASCPIHHRCPGFCSWTWRWCGHPFLEDTPTSKRTYSPISVGTRLGNDYITTVQKINWTTKIQLKY